MSSRKIKYNPAFLSDEELIHSFSVHQADLDLILQSIRENATQSNQHWLLIGPRGIGKTMLALRTAAEVRRDKDLQQLCYPIVFGEESYEVSSPGRFWLEALLHLGQQTQDARWQRAYADLRTEREDRLRERALGQLMDFADTQNKRLLLVVENLHMLLGEQITKQDAWILRDVFLNEKRIMLLGSATNRFKEIDHYQKAFYEVFRPLEIKPLSTAECAAFWLSVTGRQIDLQHIRPVEILTGGNPRLLMIVASVEKNFSLRNLLEDLEQWVDDHTDYLKSFLDNLAATERRVYLALAEIWDPATAKAVAEQAGLGVNVTSSLLKRLVERGAVLSLGSGTRKNEYKVAERLYNIYYLMRRSGGASSRVIAVVKFMSNFYAPDELVEKTRHLAEEACELGPKERRAHFYAYRNIIETVKDKKLRSELLQTTPAKFFEAEDAPAELKELYNLEVLHSQGTFNHRAGHIEKTKTTGSLIVPTSSSPDDHWLALLEKARSQIDQPEQAQEVERVINEVVAVVPSNAESQTKLGVVLHRDFRRMDAAEAAYRRAIEVKPDYAWAWALLGLLLHVERKRFADAEAAFRKAIELTPDMAEGWGQLGLLLHVGLKRFADAEAAYRKALELKPDFAWAWAQLGQLLHEELNQFPEAEAAYRKALKLKPTFAWAWAQLGQLLFEEFKRFADAEAAHRKALELKPDYAWAWAQLGRLLHEGLKRFPEAETAYRKALELKPGYAWAWAQLGRLLHEELKQFPAAEAAYHKALELKPDFTWAWAQLGQLLHEGLKRFPEAETAYRKALELKPDYAWAWAQLGQLLHEKLKRFPEAETVYRQALELKPNVACGWAQLGQLLHEELKRFPEAEAAYRKAIELEPNVACGWAQLGQLFHEELKRFPEAEAAYRKAIELEPDNAWPWGQLGQLLHEELKRFPEAETAYRKAIELKPDYAWAWQALLSLLLTVPNRLSDALEILETSLRAHPNDAEFFNGFAWRLFQCGQTELLPKAEQTARRAVKLDPMSGAACHTLATILCAEGKASEALEPAQKYLQDAQLVESETGDAINLFVDLAAAGQSREALRILRESPSGKLLEPLIVGIRVFLNEEVKVAAEILEVGKDVAERIRARQAKRHLKSAGSDSH